MRQEIRGLFPPTHTDTERLDALLSQPVGAVVAGSDGRIEFRPARHGDGDIAHVSSVDLPILNLLDALVESRSNIWDDHFHAVSEGKMTFGFTRDDVAMLRTFASPPDLPPFAPLLRLADRIEALLPKSAQ